MTAGARSTSTHKFIPTLCVLATIILTITAMENPPLNQIQDLNDAAKGLAEVIGYPEAIRFMKERKATAETQQKRNQLVGQALHKVAQWATATEENLGKRVSRVKDGLESTKTDDQANPGVHPLSWEDAVSRYNKAIDAAIDDLHYGYWEWSDLRKDIKGGIQRNTGFYDDSDEEDVCEKGLMEKIQDAMEKIKKPGSANVGTTKVVNIALKKLTGHVIEVLKLGEKLQKKDTTLRELLSRSQQFIEMDDATRKEWIQLYTGFCQPLVLRPSDWMERKNSHTDNIGPNTDNYNAVDVAGRQELPLALKWMLHHGAEVSSDENGRTTFLRLDASEYGRFWPVSEERTEKRKEVMRILLIAGSDPTKCWYYGKNWFHYARESEIPQDIVDMVEALARQPGSTS